MQSGIHISCFLVTVNDEEEQHFCETRSIDSDRIGVGS